MEREKIASDLIEIIKPYLPEEVNMEDLDESKHLLTDLKINSAHIVDIVLDTEEKFDIMIEDDVISQMETVGSVIDIISKKLES
jgi:acyl carrier protein